MSRNYVVKIDDNYHFMDESERITAGSYDTLEEAIRKCEEITIRSLSDLYERGITPERLSAQWAMFGDDPFIVGGEGPVPFSAREFITYELCKKIIEDKRSWVTSVLMRLRWRKDKNP